MLPRVSVIMPSLNVAGYIYKAVNSVLSQSLSDIEVICVDAGSDDGTWEMLQALAKQDDRVIIIRSNRRSYGYQVNLGISIARGEYIGVFETDDYISTEMYDDLYSMAARHNCDYVKSEYCTFYTDENGERIYLRHRTPEFSAVYGQVINPCQFIPASFADWFVWNGIYKRDFILKNNISFAETPGAAYQDIGFLYQVSVFAARVLYMDNVHYNYCIEREDSSTNKGNSMRFCYQEYTRLVELAEVRGNVANELRSLYLRMGRSFLFSCERLTDNISDEDRQRYTWFRDKLRQAIRDGHIKDDFYPKSIWDKLQVMLTSIEAAVELSQRFKKYVSEMAAGSYDVIIFGCGNLGHIAYKELSKGGAVVKCFMDNNRSLWGQRICGIPVLEPASHSSLSCNVYYLIANEMHHTDIKQQLISLGVPEERIFVY